jgi:D-alanyl-D-alanine carboxypeptidase
MQVPWQTVAQNTQPGSNAGFLINASPPAPSGAGASLALATPQPSFPSAADDEEAAEAQTNEGNTGLAPQSVLPGSGKPPAATTRPTPAMAQATTPVQQPQTQPSAPPVRVAQLAPPPPAPIQVRAPFKPRAKPAEFLKSAPLSEPGAPAVVAAYHPQPKPELRPEVGEGDISFDRVGSTSAAMNSHGWMIQIGAYANQTLARAQLASYVERSMDVLGQAARTVVPFQSVDGHTLFRARFGPFPEREAREVCSRLTQRGQTCFAAIDTR